MIRFIDTRPGLVSSSAHSCPNESLPHLRAALAKAEGPLKNGGSICSGGEVPLGVMLPVVDHLQIVDHNYGSLYYGCLKILALKYLDNKRLRKFFSEGDRVIHEFVRVHQDEIPLMLHPYRPTYVSSAAIADYWSETNMPEGLLDTARAKLDCIELVHGDAGDINKNLDVFYISNALTHAPVYKGDGTRNPQHILADAIESRLRLGGYILTTAMSDVTKRCFELTHDAGQSGMWSFHALYQKQAVKLTTERFRYMVRMIPKPITEAKLDKYGYRYTEYVRADVVKNTRIIPEGYRRAAN